MRVLRHTWGANSRSGPLVDRIVQGVPSRGQSSRNVGILELVAGEVLDALDALDTLELIGVLDVLEVEELAVLEVLEVLDDDDDDDDEAGAGENMVRGTSLVWEAEFADAEFLQLPKRG
ncbi:hypothetical protein PspLS_10152 [Pyricularia sp. CBS 133598]|nr:hypothetical protein PspLS_10152 [Pyricularia sp. CBS 133598]